ncbi:MAG: sigma-54-dependent Fis family transcriptional regulator [Sedimentisphaerales bacterium]|nr:sigma-54-dependent Fis family transcriptional regulator [Sedimentisphaerales bacterium]
MDKILQKQNHNLRANAIANVLIIDDDPALTRLILEACAKKAIRGIIADNTDTAIDYLEKDDYDLLFAADLLPKKHGLEPHPQNIFHLITAAKRNSPEMPMVMMANQDKNNLPDSQQIADAAVKAVNAGCCKFLVKPPQPKQIENILDEILTNHNITNCEAAHQGIKTLYQIVGKSENLRQTITLAKTIAPTSVPVLISGESGTGKELISYLIHHNSKRANAPYIRVNCAALSESLLESELFGHEKGAFTGAHAQRKGRFELAHGGTLLLDEITETPLRFQAKLLRVLEQQDFERVGGNDNIRVDVRIISTTNKNLAEEVENGTFRKDLYYRLNGVRLIACPLRDRTEDLEDLIWHFLNLYARQSPRTITSLDPVMMQIFARYNWPGNIRQLRNVVLTSLIFGVGSTLSLADVSWLFDELQPRPQENQEQIQTGALAGIPLVQVEKQAIMETLRQTSGNKTKAAKVLGISDRTLREKVRRYRTQQKLQTIK